MNEKEAAERGWPNAYLRAMLVRRWRERNARGVYFYATWLLFRWHVVPILIAVVGWPLLVWLLVPVLRAWVGSPS